MATKKGTTRKSSAKKATKKKQAEKTEKTQGNQIAKKVKKNGGARPGAGRKPNKDRERLNTLKDQAELHAMEEVEVPMAVGGVAKMVKMTRAHAILNMLWTEAVKNKNIPASKEYGDRTRGRARQEIDMSGEIKTADQYTPDDPALAVASKAYADYIKKNVIAGNHGE